MRASSIFFLAAQLSAVWALPAPAPATNALSADAAKAGEAKAPGGAAEGEKKEEEKKNEKDVPGQFGVAVALEAGATKQDVKYPAGKNGVLEIEFQNDASGRTLMVTENKTPAPPPEGFVALEPSSYKVSLTEGADNIKLQQVDYIRNTNSTVDIRKGKIGKLCTELNAFVIDKNVGELEFEEDENELKLVVKNMIGEWGIFIPQASNSTPATGAGAEAGKGTGAGTGTGTGSNLSMVDVLRQLLGLA